MTRDEILEYFKDINHAYNDCTRYDTLKCMLDELQEPCADAISRQAMQTELKNCEVVDVRDENDDLVGYYNADTVDSIVRNLPPVTPAEKVGQWIEHGVEEGFLVEKYTCSECDYYSGSRITNYCPSCGAKMQEVEG